MWVFGLCCALWCGSNWPNCSRVVSTPLLAMNFDSNLKHMLEPTFSSLPCKFPRFLSPNHHSVRLNGLKWMWNFKIYVQLFKILFLDMWKLVCKKNPYHSFVHPDRTDSSLHLKELLVSWSISFQFTSSIYTCHRTHAESSYIGFRHSKWCRSRI